MPDELHPERWYTAVYLAQDEFTFNVMAQQGSEPSEDDPYIGSFLIGEVADQFVEWWNEAHAAPGAPLVGDAGEVGAFLDEKPGDE